MSLSEQFWTELSSQEITDPWGEITGLTIGSGELALSGSLRIVLRRADALKRVIRIVNSLGLEHEFMVMRQGASKHRQFYVVIPLLSEEQAKQLLQRRSHEKVRWSWIRGIMLSSGYFGEPKPWYHVTMDIEIYEDALRVREWLERRIGKVYVVSRENTNTLHVRSFSAVYNMLQGLELMRTAEELYAQHYLRMKKLSAQRLANCDTANLKRQVNKFEFHEYLYKTADLGKLTEEELKLLTTRVSHPEYSYGDLARKFGVTKSKIARMLQKIEAKLRDGVA
ncbi:DNA-binding protein WhiA [Coprothermobacteraceae bacterium]|nr:DNA-binding protein WhiA [Coprothermobacteraceae bacterium]